MPRSLAPIELKKYCYWREFLLRSKRYERVCEFINTKKEIAPFTDELIYSWCPIDSELSKPYLDWIYNNISEEEYKIQFDSETTYENVLFGIYPLFQDIFNEPFSNVEHRIKLFYELHDGQAIRPARGDILTLLSSSFTKNKCHESRERHTKDIYVDFLDYIDGIYGEQMVDIDHIIRISTRYPKGVIIEQFKGYLDTILDKQILVDGVPELQPYFTSGYLNFQHFDTYLDAFDILNGMSEISEREAVKIAFPNDTTEEHKRRKKNMTNGFSRAKEYIQNAERGIFPGYGSTKSELKAKGEHPQPEYEKITHLIEAKRQEKIARGPARRYPLESYFSKEEN